MRCSFWSMKTETYVGKRAKCCFGGNEVAPLCHIRTCIFDRGRFWWAR
jgi:hypothetical protein